MKKVLIPIEVSARHIHLAAKDMEILFGRGHQLQQQKKISQPGQYAAQEVLKVQGPKGALADVRVVGPTRSTTQVELSVTDCYALGVQPHLLVSGDLRASGGGLTLVGPAGSLELKSGVIVPIRHLHIAPDQAAKLHLRHLETISLRAGTKRNVIFNNVTVRSREGIDALALHLDTDEANAAGVRHGDFAEVLDTKKT